ncbi:uncharacterized protein LOC105285738 isoform X1 [Ooceraea biroi]|uniref:uncharacterized protein LOC105285738 isoform X1 n=1 Tax=Ooceraea biroi TaxID=2015173 RepID=UPI000F08337C|nr:uncharacterized protein LOC105285738 isoform X1 [Ooceraea biroi]
MTFAKSSFYNINRILLLVLGIWPDQKNKCMYVQRLFVWGIFTSFIICQLLLFFTEKYTVSLFFNTLSQSLPIVVCLLKYNAFCSNKKSVKLLLEQIEHDWITLDDRELEIMKQYASTSKLYVVTFISFAVATICIYAFLQLLPAILDFIIPLNISRPRYLYVRFEFSIDEEKHFYAITFYTVVSLFVASATVISIGTSILTFGNHSCAMLKIACYRMEHAMDKYKRLHFVKRNEMQNEMVRAVDIHRKAMEYTNILISTLMLLFFGLLVTGVISLTLNIFHLFYAFFDINSMEEILISTFLICAHFLYMFWANYAFQQIADHFHEIFIAAYAIPWYVAPVRIQKFIIFLLQRGTKNYTMQIGGVFTGSLEGFATVINTSNQFKQCSDFLLPSVSFTKRYLYFSC